MRDSTLMNYETAPAAVPTAAVASPALVARHRKGQLVYENLGQILDRYIAPREYLMSPWLKDGESALLYAAPGVGKSMLTLTLALAVAGGGSFLDWSAPKARKVLYLDGEMADADIQERFNALLPSVSGLDMEAVRRNLCVLARQRQDPDSDFPDLVTPEGQRYILNRVRKRKVDLLILDNYSTLFTTVEDENAAASFNEVVAFLMRLKQAGVGCILVHHTNKDGSNYRGSSKLATTFEVILGLTKGDAKDDDGPSFEMTWDKFRGKRRDAVTMPRKVHLAEGFDGRLAWQSEKSPKAHIVELVEAVKSMQYGSQNALAAHFGVAKGTISKWKTAAIHDYRLITEKAWNEYLAQAGPSAGAFPIGAGLAIEDDGDDGEDF